MSSTRGVDLNLFRPGPRDPWDGLARPVFLYAGRVAVEKNIEAFLRLDLPGSKAVLGDGPRRRALQARVPAARFAGWRQGAALAAAYAGADVSVFPSRTDTFELAILEAMACGTPVAAFLALDLPGSKVVVGDGPQRAALQRRFPAAHFAGWRRGEALARAYAGADVSVFPSRTDTFGLVILESLACGTPVAAYPVTGPRDVLVPGTGALDGDLRAAALAALGCDRARCRAHAEGFSWDTCAEAFRRQLAVFAAP